MKLAMDVKTIEVDLEECALVQFRIPPLVLADGTKLKLAGAQMRVEPISVLVPHNGDMIKALFHPTEGRWEIVENK